MRPQRLLTTAALLATLSFGTAAQADATLTFSDSRSPQQTSFLIHDGRILMQGQGRDGSKFSSIYDSGRKQFIMIDHARKRYYTMDEQTVEKQMEMMDRARQMMKQQLEAQLKDMPPEQRKMMEQRMQAMFAKPEPAPAPRVEVKDTGERRDANGIPCRVFRIIADGKPERETCVAKPRDLGLSDADYRALRSMFDYMSRMADRFASRMGGMHRQNTAELMSHIDGIPVSMKHLTKGYESRLEGLSTDALDPSLFQVPPGFQKVDPLAEMERNMPKGAAH
ncbi:MAG: hypothetical protein D6717_04730 [Gammaproteobacteria bacterium]|nr:MAG: hypothetical protein D6717_04730 [Gammaproteobacteria bacterium]